MAKKKEVDTVLELAVSFGNQSAGDKTARIGVTVDRSNLKLTVADKQLCERRLTGCMIAKNGQADQPTFAGMEDDLEIVASFDVKSIKVDADHISFGLTFNLKDIDVGKLAKFAKREGQLLITEITDIPVEEKSKGKSKDDDDNDDDANEE